MEFRLISYHVTLHNAFLFVLKIIPLKNNTKRVKLSKVQNCKTSTLFTAGATTLSKRLVVGEQVWVETGSLDTFNREYNVFSGNIIHVDF